MDEELLQIARVEVGERLDRLQDTLLELDIGTEASPEVIDELFRDAHTIKGTAAMLGWEQLSTLSDVLEERLSGARKRGELPEGLIDPSLKAVYAMRRTLLGDEVDPAPVLEAFSAPRRAAPAPGGTQPVPVGGSIRIPAHKVDRMLDAVGEAVLHHRRLEHRLTATGGAGHGTPVEEEMSVGERLLGELQDAVLAMRTLPLSSITAPFARAVRDVATQAGRQVELRMQGTDTQLDRVILEGISGAITHLLRNAVAHGIEPPEERRRLGKPATGQIVLRASQRHRQVVVDVSDDGRGVSPELLARAEESGSLAGVLAQAGLSTAGGVSRLAGRGVGLDAVRSYVEGLGGQLEATSEPGRGTTFTMLLPLTLALLEVLLCERGGQPFGIPMSAVREVVALSEPGQGSLESRGETVPVADLAELIGATASPLDPPAPAIVLAGGQRIVAAACERVLGNQEVVLKGLGELLAGIRAYLGAAILGDGRIALILDPAQLLGQRTAAAASGARVLVVDDQRTARELGRRSLEAAGYAVETAADGREALERLGRPPPISLVVTDIQMPEMDGWELLRRLRADAVHRALPVLVVTSGSEAGESDRSRALELGADGYLLKQELDPEVLRDTVARLLSVART